MYVCSNGVKTAVILQDTMAESPREPGYQDNITNMICWHSRYRLGDKHDYKEPMSFAVDMAEKYLKPQDVFQAMANGELGDFRLIDEGNGGEYLVDAKVGLGAMQRWERMDWKVSREFEVVEAEDVSFDLEMDVLANCWPDELMRMCEKYGEVAIQPLYLYDHSGISMSTSSFVGRAHQAEWDSGQVGYIFMDKKTAMRELAMPTDEVRLAMPLEGYKSVRLAAIANHDFDYVMEANGYYFVRLDDLAPSEVLESPEGQRVADLAAKGALYKKDNTLYILDKPNYGERGHNDETLYLNSYDIKPIFSFNTGYQPLTEENWRARAEKVLEADVKEYDNYLTGEVYGYKLFEGTKETESCWGFNPGKEDIEDLMNDELRGWFGADMEFQYESESGEDFDIDEFFENNDFPELREKIEQDVVDFIKFEDETSKVYPFAVSAEELLANAGGVLESIVNEIYEQHEEYDAECIYAAIEAHAGVSREAQPKLKAEDLEPGKEYTAEEIMDLMREKGRPQGVVQNILDNATSRAGAAKDLGGLNKDDGIEL